MQCLYCGKEVPLRMRLTGEEHFCSPEHKRLYQEEHSRLGLARLLEEVTARSDEGSRVDDPGLEAGSGGGAEGRDLAPAGIDEQSVQGTGLAEPELVASGNGLKLWRHSEAQGALQPVYAEFLRLNLAPAEYAPAPEPAAKKGAEIEREPASVTTREPVAEAKPKMPVASTTVASTASQSEPAPLRSAAPATAHREVTDTAPPQGKPAVVPNPPPESPRRQGITRTAEPKAGEVAESSAAPPMFTFGNPRYVKAQAEPKAGEVAESSAAPPMFTFGNPRYVKAQAEPKAGEVAESSAAPPMFTFGNPRYATAQSKRQQSAMMVRIAAGAVIAIALGAGAYWGISSGQFGSGGGAAATRAAGDAAAGAVAAEWIPNWSSDQQGQEIALFGPSQEWSDYRVQWEARMDQGVAWVFRASDPNNYYVIRLDRAPGAALRLVRYAVIGGAATGKSEESVRAAPAANAGFDVQLEVDGAEFTLYLDGHNVARWSDDKLRRGGFGIIRHDLGLAGVNDVKVVQLQRNSAFHKRFWTGDPPENLPEVTLIRSGGGSRPNSRGGSKPGTESSL